MSLAGLSLQYAAAGSNVWSVVPLSGSIAPGKFFLVAFGPTGSGAALTADLSSPVDLTTGRVALMNTAVAATAACPPAATVVDLLGFGVAPGCTEGSSAAAPGTDSLFRESNACADTDDNSADFVAAAPVPRNSSSAAVACACVVQNETNAALEADYCNVQFPPTLSSQTGVITPAVYGQFFETGVSEAPGPNPGVRAQLGFGPTNRNPQYEAGWKWLNASFNVQSGNNDEYQATFVTPAVGTWNYTYRFSLDRGVSWTVCDVDGSGSNGGLTFSVGSLGVLTSTP